MIETRALLYLLRSVIRFGLSGSVVLFLGILIFDKLGVDIRAFLLGSWIVALPGSIGLGMWLTSANFSWLIGLPISRIRLIFLQYVLQTLIIVSILALLTWITLAWYIYHQGLQETLTDIAQVIERVRTVVKENPPSNWHLTTWANFITFITWFSLIPLFSLRRGRAGLTYSSSSYSRKKQRKGVMYGLGISVIFFLTRSWLSWGLIGYCVLNSLAAYFGTQIAIHQLGLSPARRKIRLGIGLCLASLNILAIVIVGQSHLRSGSADKIADVISFAGPYTGNADPAKIAHALEADISAWNVHALGQFYKSLLNQEKPLAPTGHPLTFQAAIQSKTSLDALISAAELFDVNQISFDDLKMFLLRAEKIKKTADPNYLVYNLMKRSFSEAQISALLESDSDILQVLAIRWIRFHPSNQLLTLLEDRLNTYSDINRLKALTTLSFGASAELHLSDYQSARKPKLNVRYTPADCKNYSVQDLKPSITNPLPKINLCLRDIALSKSGGIHQRIDSVGWYTEDELKNRSDSLKRDLGLKQNP